MNHEHHHHEQGLCEIRLDRVSVKKGGRQLLKDISFTLHCGQLTALIGPNGAGKSTLLRTLLGDIRYTGQIRFTRFDGFAARPAIGFVPQLLDFDRTAPISVVDFMATAYSKFPVFLGIPRRVRRQVHAVLERMGCAQVENRRLGELSGGELQRVLLAMALSPIPDVLILDEPFSGIDQVGTREFHQLVMHMRDAYHLAIVLVSHDLAWARENADQILLLDSGELRASGSAQEVFSDEELIRSFGEEGL